MAEDENKETSEEQAPEEQVPEAEGSEETPTAEGDSASASDEVAEDAAEGSQGDGATPDDSGREAEQSSDDSEEEQTQDEAPAAEGEAAEASAEGAEEADEGSQGDGATTDAPGREAEEASPSKKDVIPGADLEPIAVEEDAAPLSAEERARREAEEEEERARREAELGGDSVEDIAKRAPAKMDSDARFLATGKRKTSIARVTVTAGSGNIEINKRALEEFFPRPLHQTVALQALTTAGYRDSVDVRVRVHGGGISGQAGAIRHGIARALTEIDPELRGELKRRGFLTRDARVKERRKAGLKKARKRPQFSKR